MKTIIYTLEMQSNEMKACFEALSRIEADARKIFLQFEAESSFKEWVEGNEERLRYLKDATLVNGFLGKVGNWEYPEDDEEEKEVTNETLNEIFERAKEACKLPREDQ
jgi:predicted urease superfamily metal-dependent hydrolase